MLNMLDQFRNLDTNRLDIAQLVTMAAFGRILRAEYEAVQIDEPSWLDTNLKSIRREIHARNADQVEKLLKEKRAKLENLKTPAEKKKELLSQIKDLEKQAAAIA
jgi:hypothetical protein